MADKLIVTIGRQTGSGGRKIGQMLAERLGVKCYDKELLDRAAKESGLCRELFENNDEKPTNSFLYSLVMDTYSLGYSSSPYVDMPINQKIFLAQFDTIRNLAASESCVIVGRCGFDVFANHPNALKIFVHSSLECRKRRIAEKYDISEFDAAAMIVDNDYSRELYTKKYTGRNWLDATNYDVSLDVRKFGVNGAVDFLMNCIE